MTLGSMVNYDTRYSLQELPPVDRAIVAVSGGMDSTVCLRHAVNIYGSENVVAIAIYYGQKHENELHRADKICRKLNVRYDIIDFSYIFKFNSEASALLKGSSKEISQGKDYSTLMKEKIANGEVPISDEYVPNRNSLFLNILCSIGLQVFNNKPFALITGIHADDALKQEGSDVCAYPDCSVDFANATNKALQIATAGLCYLYTPLVNKTKTMVAEFGIANKMTKEDFDDTWSCYKGEDKQCGKCPTCIDRIKALVASGIYTKISDILDYYDISEEEAESYLIKD